MLTFDVNWLAIVVVTAIDMVLGSLWYSPLLFSKLWLKSLGKSTHELSGMATAMTTSTIVAFLSAFVLAVLIRSVDADGLLQGAGLGALAWLGFVLTNALLTQIFEGRNATVNILFVAYRLLALVIGGVVLAIW